MRLLISTFEDSPWEQTFVHLINVAVQENSCNAGNSLKTEKQKAAAIIKLKTGNVAPPLIMNDAGGKPVDLFAITAKITLLMFWSPDCEHCAEAMPGISDIYTQYKPMGFEIFAVSVGSDKNAWQKMVVEKKMNWINVSDMRGPDSEALINYNAWTTPTFIVLDEHHKILARPINVAQVNEFLKEIF
jgi:peroxiredoxin